MEPCTAGKATLPECYAERRSMQLIQVHQPDRSISSHLLPLFLSDVIFVFGHPYFFIFCLACLAVVPRGVDLQFQQAKWGAMGGYMRSLAHTHAQDPHSHSCNLWLPQSSRTVCPEESVHDTCTSHLQCLRVLSWGGGLWEFRARI